MTVFQINPSSAYIVSPDTSIAECVRAMRDHNFGAILISDPMSKRLIGIFTERDLLKWFDEIQKGHWEKPVFRLMSQPVFTISLEELDEAPRIMIERNIRHLPVFHTDPVSHETITSMVSMRDLLRDLARTEASHQGNVLPKIRVGMIAQTEGVRYLLRKVCAKRGNSTVESIDLNQAIQNASQTLAEFDFLLFDLDQIESRLWISLLREINLLSIHPEVLLIYDPSLQKEATLDILTQLDLSGRFSAFMKPLNFFNLVSRLSA